MIIIITDVNNKEKYQLGASLVTKSKTRSVGPSIRTTLSINNTSGAAASNLNK